jgi:hypothetical protein
MLNSIGDLFQIIPAVEKSLRPDWDSMSYEEMVVELQRAGHCSGLIKVTGTYDDLFMAHSSWFEYANMNRIFKNYHFAFNAPTGANKISFSSYPGYLESLDGLSRHCFASLSPHMDGRAVVFMMFFLYFFHVVFSGGSTVLSEKGQELSRSCSCARLLSRRFLHDGLGVGDDPDLKRGDEQLAVRPHHTVVAAGVATGSGRLCSGPHWRRVVEDV